MSTIAHILTSHILQGEGCSLYRDNPGETVTDERGRYVVGGAVPALEIAPTVHGASTIYRMVNEWLDTHAGSDAPIVGVWVDVDTGIVYVDMSNTYVFKSPAIIRARNRGELSIWDLHEKREIRVAKGMTWRELYVEIENMPGEWWNQPATVIGDADQIMLIESVTPAGNVMHPMINLMEGN